MPKKTVFEAVQEIRQDERFKDVPIIAISASVFDMDQERSRAVGCQDFISKPVNQETLLSVFVKYLDLDWLYETE